MVNILAIANQKGGVGKTTTTINLAASLSKMNKKVLLVDLDPQGNATMGSGVEKSTVEYSIYDVLTARCKVQDAIVTAGNNTYMVLPANSELTAAEVELLDFENKETCLKSALNSIADRYDYILIDCPPSLNMLTLNALVAADSVLIPMQCEYFALEGLSALSETIGAIAESVNPKLVIKGLIRTMYDPRNKLTLEVSQQLKDFFTDKVFRTVIPRNVRLAEAPSYGLPIIEYDKNSSGALAYLALAGELIRRDSGHNADIEITNDGS